jgi:hypothetical protein
MTTSNESSDLEHPSACSRKIPEERVKSAFLGCDPLPVETWLRELVAHRSNFLFLRFLQFRDFTGLMLPILSSSLPVLAQTGRGIYPFLC